MNHMQPLAVGEVMALGDEGVQVAELQRRLAYLGYYLGAVDERYGETTEAAMREFQRAYGLTEDGRVELETWEALDGEARSAGYDPDARLAEGGAYEPDEQQYQTIEPGQLSEDGQWRWDGAEWQAAEPAGTTGTTGTTGATTEETRETPATDVSEYPEVKDGDSGEWVEYLDAMLRSKGF